MDITAWEGFQLLLEVQKNRWNMSGKSGMCIETSAEVKGISMEEQGWGFLELRALAAQQGPKESQTMPRYWAN